MARRAAVQRAVLVRRAASTSTTSSGPTGPDATLRPNQVLAVSLSPDLLPPHRARAVYWTLRRRLLTPFGLRTLDRGRSPVPGLLRRIAA